jgi:carboxylesterase type B
MKFQMFFNLLQGISLLFLARASPSLRDVSASSPLVVDLTSGSFRGVLAGSPNNTDKWLGIPFAQPPVGNLRFKAPVAITNPSRTVKNATQFGNACPQIPADHLGAPIGEDCLFLNVNMLAGK